MEFTQKQRLHKPVYESVNKGAVHEPIFAATVIVNGQKYDSPPSSCSRTVKAAEHAAARVALEELFKEEGNASAGNYPSAVLDSGLCKTRVMHANTTHATCQRPNASREIKRGLPYAQ